MKNFILTLLVGFVGLAAVSAQTVDELKTMKAEKQAAADALLAEVADLDKQIYEFPGWKFGGVGIAGFDLNSNTNWFANALPNSQANGWGLSLGAFANLDREKYFWRNLGNLNLKRVNTLLDRTLSDEDQKEATISTFTDNLDASSLFGYKLTEKIAVSAEAKYISSLLNFNNPGQLTASAGVTWTPIQNLVVLIHPLGYQWNFPGDRFVSSVGAKIGATYAAEIIPGVAWSSNLSAFVPYGEGSGVLQAFEETANSTRLAPEYDFDKVLAGQERAIDYSQGDLLNWLWINSFSTSLFKGIGVGLTVGLRQDKQVANQALYNNSRGSYDPSNPGDSNPSAIQSYYTLGLSYNF